jgi:hypothetical protein
MYSVQFLKRPKNIKKLSKILPNFVSDVRARVRVRIKVRVRGNGRGGREV